MKILKDDVVVEQFCFANIQPGDVFEIETGGMLAKTEGTAVAVTNTPLSRSLCVKMANNVDYFNYRTLSAHKYCNEIIVATYPEAALNLA